MVARKTDKRLITARLTGHIEEVYKPQEGPVFLDFHKVYNKSFQSDLPGCHTLRKDTDETYKEFRRLSPCVRDEFYNRHGVFVVNVNKHARELVTHGSPPSREGACTDAKWRQCLSPRCPPIGWVLLPESALKNHPVLDEQVKRRLSRTTSSHRKAVDWADKAEISGLLTKKRIRELRKPAVELAHEILQPKLPLSPRSENEAG